MHLSFRSFRAASRSGKRIIPRNSRHTALDHDGTTLDALRNDNHRLQEPPEGLRRRDFVVLLAAAASLQLVAWAILLALFSARLMGHGFHDLSDFLVYQLYGVRFLMGQWPYADVAVEYPPLANLVFLLAPVHGTVAEYERWLSTILIAVRTASAVVTAAAAALLWRSAGRALAVAAVLAALTLCCGALAANRYDALVALVIAATMLLLALRTWAPAAACLGIGFALKLTPALLLPLVLLLAASRRRAIAALAAFAIAAALPFAPFLIHDPTTVGYPFTYHSDRPLQIESVLGTPWLAATLAGGEKPAIVRTYGSQNLGTAVADALAAASPWLMLAVVAAVYALAWRRRAVLRREPRLVAVAALAVVLVAVCTSKVLSPQFLIWTFPLVALTAVLRSRLASAAAVACAVATLLTQVEFPARYWRLVAFEPGPVAVLVARNIILVVAAALAVLSLARVSLPAADAPEPWAEARPTGPQSSAGERAANELENPPGCRSPGAPSFSARS